MFRLNHRSIKVTLFSEIHIKIISKISLTYHQIAFFPRNTRVGKRQKRASIFGKNAKFDVFGENAKNAILGSLDFRASPKTDFAKNEISIYSGNPLYPQKAKSFILAHFLFQGILGLPSRSWLALSYLSIFLYFQGFLHGFK